MRIPLFYLFMGTSLLLGACRQPYPVSPVPQRDTIFAASQSATAKGHWYGSLSPELQAYYAPVKDLQGRALFEALSERIRATQVLNYGEATAFLYTRADQRQQGRQSQVRAVYSGIWITGDGSSGHKYKEDGDANRDGKKGDGINCEHTWPQGFFNKQEPMRSDMHHLFPTLTTPNTRRSHYPLDNVGSHPVTYATGSGSQLARVSSYTHIFEPNDRQKGDSARALLYFYLRYHKENIRQNDYRADFFLPRLNTYRQWMQQDLPDAVEKSRHEKIALKQGNRNPFVDIPNLLDILGTAAFTATESQFARQNR